ncbi:MAG: DsbA family protein [Candidatus Solibacter usitatus]|nr:DsbA family protein [Candidatus Solibacter usitatus]
MRKLIGLALLAALSIPLPGQNRAASTLPATPGRVAAPSSFDKLGLENFVRHLLLWGPQITVTVADPAPGPMPGYQEVKVTGAYQQASLDEVFYVSQDGRKIVRGAVYDIGKSPFAAELAKLKTDLSPSMGTPGAQVVIVLFSDFQCAYCRDAAKTIRDNLLKTYPKEVRLYFKDFPIEQIHPWAKTASIAGRCVFRQNPGAFWEYHDWIFDKQQEMTVDNLKAKISEWAQAKGLDAMQFSRCYDNRSTEADIARSMAEGRALRLSSTPTMFINGRQVPGSVPWPQLKAILDWELDYSKKTGESGEKCCEITLPVPGKK